MRFIPEEKIDVVNQLAALICQEMCGSDNCGLCQFANLSSGIDMALGDKMPVEQVKAAMLQNYRNILSSANAKYDRYQLHEAV